MKAIPARRATDPNSGYVQCPVAQATHVALNLPGPTGVLVLPVILRGSRDETGCWSWNGNTDIPTIRPSVKTTNRSWTCHSWIGDGLIQFLDDSTHEFKGQTIDLLDVPDDWNV